MVSPELIAVGVTVALVGAGAVYSYATGRETTVDTDDNEITFGGEADDTTNTSVEGETVEQDFDPTPAEVKETDGLTEITGIQETRAQTLREAGFETPEDLYYASDENLEAVNGFGEYTVSQIRDDIGSVDDEPTDE
jgi:predicted flap endonuclease-1-like 5' DNA nuclease